MTINQKTQNLMLKTMKTDDAIALLKQGGTSENIVLSDIEEKKLGFQDALLLVENGFLVPRGNIIYRDSEVEHDADFDEVTWNKQYQKLNDLLVSKKIITPENITQPITLEISIQDKAVQQWMQENKSKLKKVVSKLMVDLYHTDQILHSK